MTEQNNEALAERARADFQKNASSILALGAKHNKRDLAEKAIGDGLSIEQFRGVVLDAIADAPLEMPTDLGMTKKERNEDYSLLRAIRGAMSGGVSGYELEVSNEIAKRTGKDPRGFMFQPIFSNVI